MPIESSFVAAAGRQSSSLERDRCHDYDVVTWISAISGMVSTPTSAEHVFDSGRVPAADLFHHLVASAVGTMPALTAVQSRTSRAPLATPRSEGRRSKSGHGSEREMNLRVRPAMIHAISGDGGAAGSTMCSHDAWSDTATDRHRPRSWSDAPDLRGRRSAVSDVAAPSQPRTVGGPGSVRSRDACGVTESVASRHRAVLA